MPRKTTWPADAMIQVVLASMRPRPDAAENERQRRTDDRMLNASMRPRPDAAENIDAVSSAS